MARLLRRAPHARRWDESIWDLSGDLPFFKGASAPEENPDVNPGGQLPDFGENEFYQ